MTAFFIGDLYPPVALLTIAVPELASVDWLLLLALPFPAFAAGAGWGALLPLPTPDDELLDDEAVTGLDAVARVDLAFSTIFVKRPAVPLAGGGPMDLYGETGLAR